MSDGPPNDAAITVEDDGIRVAKSFSDDEFPVPAVVFDITSTRAEPVRLRLVDLIPESFPMDRVGFHPDFESENWTAYNDNRVEFEYVIEPGKELRTVFGIRAEDPDVDAFLSVPTVEVVPEGEEIEDVIGADSAEVVREVLGGETSTLPGMADEDQSVASESQGPSQEAVAAAASEADGEEGEDEDLELGEPDLDEEIEPDLDEEIELDLDENTDEVAETEVESDLEPDEQPAAPRSVSGETTAAVTPHTPSNDAEVVDDDVATTDTEPESGTEPELETEPGSEAEPESETEAGAKTETEPGGVAAALAAEIRAGTVADDDLELLKEELDLGTPRSVEARISNLQSRLADLAAYADALEEFIDEEGTAEEILEDLQASVSEVEGALADLESRVDDAAEERETIASDLATTDERVDSVYERVDSVDARVGEVTADLSDVEGHVESTEEELGDVWEDIAEMDSRVVTLETELGGDVADLDEEIERIDEELAELGEFRDRLSDAFGT